MAGSSARRPARPSARAGIPEMRRRGYSGGFRRGHHRGGRHARHPAAAIVTMLLYAVAAEVVAGANCFSPAIVPGLMLITMFAVYSAAVSQANIAWPQQVACARGAFRSAILAEEHYTLREKLGDDASGAPFSRSCSPA